MGNYILDSVDMSGNHVAINFTLTQKQFNLLKDFVEILVDEDVLEMNTDLYLSKIYDLTEDDN